MTNLTTWSWEQRLLLWEALVAFLSRPVIADEMPLPQPKAEPTKMISPNGHAPAGQIGALASTQQASDTDQPGAKALCDSEIEHWLEQHSDDVPRYIDKFGPCQRDELEISTVLIRTFLGIAKCELIELTAFVNDRAWIAQCETIEQHIELLRRAHDLRGYRGSYVLVNGPINPELAARYEQRRWIPANNGRATDKDIGTRRAVFIDVDPIRPKGISSTNEEFEAARDVAWRLRDDLASNFGPLCLGFGCSGNGFYILIAIKPLSSPLDSNPDVERFLKAVARKFGTERVKIDRAVANPARLMSCPGTWKRKGRHTDERPHRMTSFSYRVNPKDGRPEQIPLGELL